MPSAILFLLLSSAWAQIPSNPQLRNWQAPAMWQPAAISSEKNETRATDISAPLTLIAVQPCRILDTRPSAPPNQRLINGPIPGVTNVTVPIRISSCGLPSTALAYSLNITVDTTATAPLSFLSAWPTGSDPSQLVSVLNAPLGGFVSNAAVVGAGVNGSIDLFASSSTHVIIDVNGYYSSASVLSGPVAVYRTPPAPDPATVLCPAVVQTSVTNYSIKEIDTHEAAGSAGGTWQFTAPIAGLYKVDATLDQPVDATNFTLEVLPIAGALSPIVKLRSVQRGTGGRIGPPLSISTAFYMNVNQAVRTTFTTGACSPAGWISIHYLRP